MIRAVLDTDIVVSSLVQPSGTPGRLRRAWQEDRFELALSEPLLRELAEVLARPVIQRLLKVAPEEIERFLRLVAEIAVWSEEELVVVTVIDDDPANDIVLATALATRADVIVSGDRHLLDLELHRDIPILRPRQFLEALPAP